jgi:hypothetical protein
VVITTPHNNATGKQNSSFRPCFDQKQPNIMILGSMTKQIDVFSMPNSSQNNNNKLSIIHTFSSGLSSVCSRNAIHPKLEFVAGGSSSGKVYLFFEHFN